MVKNLNVTEVRDSDFKNAFPEVSDLGIDIFSEPL